MSRPIIVNGHTVPKLTVQDILELQEREFVVQKKALIASLDDAGADENLRVEKLMALRRRSDLGDDLIMSAYGIRGASAIIRHALGDSVTTLEDLELDPTGDLQKLALELLGVRMVSKQEEDDSDPTNPLTGTGTRQLSPT